MFRIMRSDNFKILFHKKQNNDKKVVTFFTLLQSLAQ